MVDIEDSNLGLAGMEVRPTLFIALGGTGAEIALRIRRRILTHAWGSPDNQVRICDLSDFPLAQFIHYDLDEGSVRESEKHRDTDSLADAVAFSQDEKILPACGFLIRYCRNDQEIFPRYPHIRSWPPVTPAGFESGSTRPRNVPTTTCLPQCPVAFLD